jgi:NAD(P)-dependent dehydrogenase (short-subunit alcohol dehydrogenase family)
MSRTGFGRIRDELGPVDILLNNVGQSARERMSDFWRSDLETLDFMLAINLKSCILCSRQGRRGDEAAAPRQDREHCVGVRRQRFAALLGLFAAKAGVIGFTRALARELAPFGVNVNAIGPGPVRTRAMDQLRQGGTTIRSSPGYRWQDRRAG